MFMRFKSTMTSMGIVRGCSGFAAQHLVQIERDALAVADGIHDHQRLARSHLHDVARRKEVRVAETAEPVDLDRAALVLELGRATNPAMHAVRRR